MDASDFIGAVEVGERAGNAQHAVVTARREPHRIGGFAQQRKPAAVWPRHVFDSEVFRNALRLHLALIRAHEAGVKLLMKKDDSEEGVPVTLFAQSE